MASNIKITFLGTGGSLPKPGRALPAVAVHIDDVLNLFDCGEGTQKQIMKSSISYMDIKNIFITHFHGDHFLGLAGLINTMSFSGRENDLNIYGPPGAIYFVKKIIDLGYYSLNFNIKITELDYGKTYDLGKFLLRTLKSDHPVPAISYSIEEKDAYKIDRNLVDKINFPVNKLEALRSLGRLEINNKIFKIEDVSLGIKKGRKIVYSGDTRPLNSMVEFAKNADVLIHDSTMDSSMEPMVNEYGHTSSRQAAEIAREANVKKLYLFHYSARYNDLKILLNDALSVFPRTYLSTELMDVDVPKDTEVIPLH